MIENTALPQKEGIVMRLKYFRSSEDVQEDSIMPFLGLGAQPGTEVRMNAIVEVLRRLTKKDYRILKSARASPDVNRSICPC